MRRIEDELREKLPGMSGRAANGSRAAAVYLFCFSCTGGDRKEARRCKVTECFLWPYSPAAKAAGRAAAHDDEPDDEGEETAEPETPEGEPADSSDAGVVALPPEEPASPPPPEAPVAAAPLEIETYAPPAVEPGQLSLLD